MAFNAVATPPRSSTPNRNSDEMIFLGQSCNHDACSLVDFLPLKCQYCNLSFCSSHHVTTFSPLVSPSRPGHICAQSPPSHALDRITPLCPICSLPVSIPIRQDGTQEDPNGPMERHIANSCKGVDGKKEEMKRKRENGEICWKRGCGKGLVVKIRCEACNHQFCPSHRYTKDHTCESLNSNPSSSSTTSLSKPNNTSTIPSSNHLFGARKEAALAAMKRFGQNVGSGPGSSSSSGSGNSRVKSAVKSKPETTTPVVATKVNAPIPSISEPTTTKKLSHKLGISPDEKRRRAELASQYESLRFRHAKGLLNPTEKVRYAELVAEKEAARRKGDGDCLIG